MYSSPMLLLALGAQLAAAMDDKRAAETPAAKLVARSADPSLIGYFSASGGGFSNGRTCDYPATVSTSGSFAQCCAPTGSCPFFTSCSAGTLLGATGATPVDCNVNGPTANVCNTAVLLASAGASTGASNLGCWASSLGSSAFSLVQDIGSATVVAAATTGSAAASGTGASGSSAATGSSGGSSGSGSGSSGSGSSGSGSSGSGSGSSSSSKAAAAPMDVNVGAGGLLAAALVAVQALL